MQWLQVLISGKALAVSGGVDSMALASLCKESSSEWPTRPSFLGLVVDHRLRLGSTDEASSVAAELSRLEIEPKILTLDWASLQGAAPTDHVENRARTSRYRALGDACYAHGINSLLVAHHADDQAETVLTRLCSGYFGSGLRGIKPRIPIPECEGIYGIDASGGDPQTYLKHPGNRHDSFVGEMAVESGGVEVFRPLLSFRKGHLISHCRSKNIRWFEDHTNQDPEYALRNTVRYMQRQELLPLALRTQRILSLSKVVAAREATADDRAFAALKRLGVTVDTNVGQARFAQPDSLTMMPNTSAVRTRIVRALVASVSPIRNIGLLDAVDAGDVLFAQGEADGEMNRGQKCQVAGVQLCPPSKEDGQSFWALHRALPTRAERLKRRILWASVTETHLPTISTGKWSLWDNRFWLQILPCGGESASHDVVEVAARFFSKADKAALKRTLDKEELRELRKALDVVPGDLRFTLLALVVRSKSSNGSTVEKLVALPSLGWSVRGWSRRSHATQSVVNAVWQYDIRYRSFDASLRTTSTPPQ